VTHDDDLDQTEVNTVEDDNNAALDDGISGLTVNLLDTEGNVVATTTTDATGGYSFDVPAGDYQVQFPDVDGQDFADQNVGDETTDSDADANGLTDVISVASGQSVSDVDASLVNEPATGDASVKGRVFRDDDKNSLDTYEDGVANIEVSLFQADGTLVSTTTTDNEGVYSFEDLAEGDYFVDFDESTLGGRVFATQDVDGNVSDRIDSDVDNAGVSEVFSLSAGQQIFNLDAGVQDPGTSEISGRYFLDENENAIDDAETGIGGVDVFLINEEGFVGQVTQTDDTGAYSFTSIDAGRYRVTFEKPDDSGPFTEQNDPHGIGDDTNDSDVNVEGITNFIFVGIGETVNNVDAGILPLDEPPEIISDAGLYEGLMRDTDPEEDHEDPDSAAAEEDDPAAFLN
jgi:hypothetical protein